MTKGVIAFGRAKQIAILDAVAAFDGFDADNDPYGEGDFGALEVEGERLFFKIDYFGRGLTGHSPRSCRRLGHDQSADDHAGRGILKALTALVMVRRTGLAPFRQGDLDGLCGIYALINAIRLATEDGHPETSPNCVAGAVLSPSCSKPTRLAGRSMRSVWGSTHSPSTGLPSPPFGTWPIYEYCYNSCFYTSF